MRWLFWAPLVAATLHIFEEFVWPGGFARWDREYRLWSSIGHRLRARERREGPA